MADVEQRDGFDLALAAVPACSLDGSGARAQKDRYGTIAPFVTNVREEATTVVVELAGDLDTAAIEEVIAEEHRCCDGVLHFEFDRATRALTVSAVDRAASPSLELIASGFRQRLGTRTSPGRRRRIGPVGTAVRVVVGLALFALAYLDKPAGLIGGVQLHDLLLGFVALPVASLAVGLAARHYLDGPLRLGGTGGTVVNLAVLVALFANHYTSVAAALFYGMTLLVAAWRGMPGCEFTVLSNALLRRDDEIGCPVFTPIDALEARRRRPLPGSSVPPTVDAPESGEPAP